MLGVAFVSLTTVVESACGAFVYDVEMPRPEGICLVNERVPLSVTVKDERGQKASSGRVTAVIGDYCGQELCRREMDLSKDNPFHLEMTSPVPMVQRLTLKSPGSEDYVRAIPFAPVSVRRKMECPADFDAFWREARARYDREVPNDFKLERIAAQCDAAVTVYRVSLTAPRGRTVDGVLSVPTDLSKGPFPVLLNVPGAGPSDAAPPHLRNRGSTVCMTMNVHFYPLVPGPLDEVGKRELEERQRAEDEEARTRYGVSRYCLAGLGVSREEYHYYDCILAHDRMISTLLSRPEADASNVGLVGSSQGGAFALILTALNGRITRTVASEPALCNLLADSAAHLPSGGIHPVEEQPSALRDAACRNAPYFDAVNFAARIRTPVRMVVGLRDTVCPPPTVWLAYSVIPAEDKRMIVKPDMDHALPPEYGELKEWSVSRRVFRDEADYLRRKFREDTADPRTGLGNAELCEGVGKIAAERKDKEPWQKVKARMFSYLCDHIAIDCSGHDWYPSFSSWRHFGRPMQRVVRERNEEIDRTLLPVESKLIREAWSSGKFSMWKDFDHSAPDWDTVLRLGWPGLEARLMENWKDEPYYQALKMSVEGVKRLLFRLETCAAERAAMASDGSVAKRRLMAQSRALKAIRTAPPSTAYEVMMFQFTYFIICERLDRMMVRSMGNVDRLLTPYYRADLASGRTTRAEFKEQLAHYWWQWGSLDNYMGQPIWVGGTKADGSTEYNEVSDIVFEVHDELNLPSPKMIAKVAANTPDRYLDRLLDMARRHRSLVLVSEEAIKAILKGWRHCNDEECRTAEMNGCYEFYVRGAQNITQSSHISFLQPVADVLARASRGEFDAGSFEEFYHAYREELLSNTRECVRLTDCWERYLDDINPGNINSLTVDTSVTGGVDAYCRGYRYNDTALLSMGLGTTVDALLAVKELVYENRELTLRELGRIMAEDWKGHETLRQRMLRSKRKWGVNDAEANELGRQVAKVVSDFVNGRPNVRGGIWGFSGHCANQFIDLAKYTGATPDGRRAHDEASKNLSPAVGADTEGVTAMVNTYSSLSPVDFPVNFPIDIMMHPSAAGGERGLQALNAITRVYFANGGTSMNLNVFDVEELKEAQRHPEKYENLQIRVCGWNVRWNFLSRFEQDAYIRRAEMIQ